MRASSELEVKSLWLPTQAGSLMLQKALMLNA